MRNYLIKIYAREKRRIWTAPYPDNQAALHAAFDWLEKHTGETVQSKFGLTIMPQALEGGQP